MLNQRRLSDVQFFLTLMDWKWLKRSSHLDGWTHKRLPRALLYFLYMNSSVLPFNCSLAIKIVPFILFNVSITAWYRPSNCYLDGINWFWCLITSVLLLYVHCNPTQVQLPPTLIRMMEIFLPPEMDHRKFRPILPFQIGTVPSIISVPAQFPRSWNSSSHPQISGLTPIKNS